MCIEILGRNVGSKDAIEALLQFSYKPNAFTHTFLTNT